jgi:aminopeptidase N
MGRSVTTPEFQRAMEEGSGRDLREFFERWVYGIRSE